MKIEIYAPELKGEIERKLNIEIGVIVAKELQKIDFASLIDKRVNYLIDQSKYVQESVIRNLVQQRIAKEITIELTQSKI